MGMCVYLGDGSMSKCCVCVSDVYVSVVVVYAFVIVMAVIMTVPSR